MASLIKSKTSLFFLITLIVFVGGIIFWSSDLTSDPPMYFSGLGQSLSTDSAEYIFHARNKILFDAWDPFDYPRWTTYQYSLTSVVGYLCFSMAGVSRASAGTVGLILSLGGLLLLIFGLARHHSPWVTAVVAFCYVVNVSLLTYGRLSYLENGLIFLAASVFLVYSRWGHKIWGIVAAGVLAALATFIGKLFGSLLLPALVVAIFLSGTDNRWRSIILSIAGYVTTSALIILVLYGGDVFAAFAYVGEQSYGLRGFPAGLSSPWGFLEHLIAYGFQNRMFYLTPDVYMYFVVAGGLMLMMLPDIKSFRKLSPAAIFLACWTAMVYLGLMPLNYSPLRYALFLIPAIIALCWALMDIALRDGGVVAVKPGRFRIIGWGLLFWSLLFHVIGNVFYFNNLPHRMLAWSTLGGAVVLAAVVWFVLRRWDLRLSRNLLIGGLVLFIALTAVANGFRIRRMHYLDHNFNIAEANDDIAQILGPNAVVSGSYGPAITQNTNLKSFIHFFGVVDIDSTLFDRQPVTHLAVDMSNFQEAVKAFPQLDGMPFVATYWIRDTEVKLYNISKAFSNPEANAYEESQYEQAALMMHRGQADSAGIAMDAFMENHTLTKSSGLLMCDMLGKKQRLQDIRDILDRLAGMYPTDFYVQMQAGRFYLTTALISKDPALMDLSRRYFERGIKVNRFRTEYANRLVNQIRRAFPGRTQPAGQPGG